MKKGKTEFQTKREWFEERIIELVGELGRELKNGANFHNGKQKVYLDELNWIVAQHKAECPNEQFITFERQRDKKDLVIIELFKMLQKNLERRQAVLLGYNKMVKTFQQRKKSPSIISMMKK